MWKYVLKRVGLIFLTTFIILSLTFILMKLLPLDRAVGQIDQQIAFYENQVRLGYMYKIDPGPGATAEIILTDSIGRVFMFSQQPVMVQYLRWLNNIVTEWNWGTSTKIMLNVPAMDIIMQRLPYSIKVNVIALLLSVPLGFIFGIWAALKKNKTTDHVISTGIMVFISVPSFVMITFLMRFFAYGLNWFPTQWPSDNAPDSVRFLGYFIPVAALCFGTIAGFARYTRAELTEVMSSEFLLLARTKGLTKRQTVIRHAMRNSMVPIVPMIIGQFIGILAGSLILERLYGIPGIGQLFVNALTSKDYNVVMVDMAVYTMLGLFATLLVDLSYGIVDPRIRMGARK